MNLNILWFKSDLFIKWVVIQNLFKSELITDKYFHMINLNND